MSTDITPQAGANWLTRIRAYFRTVKQRRRRIRLVDQVIESIPGIAVGYTIHPLAHGRYVRPTEGIRHHERAFVVELLDVESAVVRQVGRDLRVVFAQEAVVMVDYSDNSAWFITY